MRSYVTENFDDYSFAFEIGPNRNELELVSEDNYLYKTWGIGKDIYANVAISNASISEYCRSYCITKGLSLEFLFTWYCSETSLRGIIGRQQFKYPFSDQSLSIIGTIPGDKISGKIELSVELIVSKEDTNRIYNKNLKLASIHKTVIIEGNMAQFPIQIISFKAEQDFTGYKHSLYKLARDLSNSEVTDLFYNTYVLYLNSDSPYLNIINGKKETLEVAEKGLVQALMSFVYAEIIRDISKMPARLGRNFKFSEWYESTPPKKKPPEMLGSVYYYLICRLARALHKENDAAYQFICENPDEAAVYMQSIIFDEV